MYTFTYIYTILTCTGKLFYLAGCTMTLFNLYLQYILIQYLLVQGSFFGLQVVQSPLLRCSLIFERVMAPEQLFPPIPVLSVLSWFTEITYKLLILL